MSDISGGGVIAKMLKQEGVRDFFGIVDGTYTHLFVSAVNEGLRMFTPRHEAVAAHMAGAYSLVGGRLGVCIASNGPGVANMLSGAAVEHLEGHRVLLITSSRRRGVTDPQRVGGYQMFDQHQLIREMSKFSVYIRDFERIPDAMREALRHCFSGRPGLVHVDVPEDVLNSFGPEPVFLTPGQYRSLGPIRAASSEIKAVAAMLAAAKTPLIHVGSGLVHALAFEELQEVAGLLKATVTTSWAANGALPDSAPQICPMSLTDLVNSVRKQADLCLCLGSRLGETDWWGKAPYWARTSGQKWIQVDLDPINIGRNHPVDLGLVADVRAFLQDLALELKNGPTGADKPERASLLAEIGTAKLTAQQGIQDNLATLPKDPVHSLEVAVTLRAMLPPDTLFVLDGGNTSVWGSAIGSVIPNSRLSTWHMGHLGSGQGYALGAAVARPDNPVCLFTGDGAMGFHMQEIETAVRYGLNIMFVVIADRQWGMVKINQITAVAPHRDRYPIALAEKDHVNGDFGSVDWAGAAVAMGAKGIKVRTLAELRDAIGQCAAIKTPTLIQIDVDPEAHMLCPALKNFKEMHNEPEGE